MSSQIEIIRSSPLNRRSLLTPNAAAVRGQWFQESATPGTAELASGAKPSCGQVTRDVVVGGPVLADHIYPGRLELPFTATQEASFEEGDLVEAEGTDFLILTGGTAIANNTAQGTELTFSGGKLEKAAVGKLVEYILDIASLTPQDATNTVRIRARKCGPYLKTA